MSFERVRRINAISAGVLLLSLFVFFVLVAHARAADMPRGLSPEATALANEMAYYRGVAIACRPTDGTVLNKAFWEPRIATLRPTERAAFTASVKALTQPTLTQLSGPDAALKCDDALDLVEDRFPSIAEAGPAAEPVCWSDVTGMNACPGIGDDDILAGVDALLDGY